MWYGSASEHVDLEARHKGRTLETASVSQPANLTYTSAVQNRAACHTSRVGSSCMLMMQFAILAAIPLHRCLSGARSVPLHLLPTSHYTLSVSTAGATHPVILLRAILLLSFLRAAAFASGSHYLQCSCRRPPAPKRSASRFEQRPLHSRPLTAPRSHCGLEEAPEVRYACCSPELAGWAAPRRLKGPRTWRQPGQLLAGSTFDSQQQGRLPVSPAPDPCAECSGDLCNVLPQTALKIRDSPGGR